MSDFIRKNILASYGLSDNLEKGKKANIGEIRVWNGEKQQKQADGSWKKVSEEKSFKSETEGWKITREDIDIALDAYYGSNPSIMKETIKKVFNKTNAPLEKFMTHLRPEIAKQWQFVKDDLPEYTRKEYIKEVEDDISSILSSDN